MARCPLERGHLWCKCSAVRERAPRSGDQVSPGFQFLYQPVGEQRRLLAPDCLLQSRAQRQSAVYLAQRMQLRFLELGPLLPGPPRIRIQPQRARTLIAASSAEKIALPPGKRVLQSATRTQDARHTFPGKFRSRRQGRPRIPAVEHSHAFR